MAKFAVTSGALNSVNLTNIIFDRLEEGDAFQNTDAFFWTLVQSEVKIISLKSYFKLSLTHNIAEYLRHLTENMTVFFETIILNV